MSEEFIFCEIESIVMNLSKYIDDYLDEDVEPKKIIEFLRTDYGDDITDVYCGTETDANKMIDMIKEQADKRSKKHIDFIKNIDEDKKEKIVNDNKKRLCKYTMKKLMCCNEKSHAEMFCDEYINKVFVTSTSGNAYVYNEDTCLFEEKIFAQMIIMIMDYLQTRIDYVFKLVEHEKDTNENKEENDNKRVNLQKARKKVRKGSHCKNVYELVIGMLYHPDFSNSLNRIKDVLPIKNRRVVELKTLKTRERTKEDLFSMEINADIIENANELVITRDANGKITKVDKLSHIKDMVSKLFKKKEDVITCFQKHCGYFITGETSEQGIYVIYGKGQNGKSSFFEILKNLLKDLYCVADKRVFMKTQSETSHDAHLLPLQHARIAVFQESEENGKFNSGQLKNLRGESTISARGCGAAKTTYFLNQSKLCILTNDKPKFSVKDSGLIRSLRYFPFEAVFKADPDETKGEYPVDPFICEKLSTEYADEVLTWLCMGAKMFYDDREKYKCIQIPDCLKKTTKENINEMDNSTGFLLDMCNIGGNYKTKRTELYKCYSTYAELNKIEKLSAEHFFYCLRQQGYEESKINGYPHFHSIEIKPDVKKDLGTHFD